ncbi:RNA polymerase sigma-70 factor [Chitinophaga solisilvae]|uniref:RNA polymerase sigma-70 factor n=1 Tax=Chitinophaga solisilvae TaxID=1233460 RepID=UPI00136FDC9C|nr:RNA polymerase sigma-70 factor [Chitinophaga solisilvae]
MPDLYADDFRAGMKINEASFLHLYECYWKKLYHLAFKYLGDAFQAEGVVQDVFTSIWQRKSSLVLDPETVENYLVKAVRFRIARKYNDDIRKSRRMEELSVRQSEADNHTEETLFCSFLREEIDRLVTGLPERCRLVYQLSRQEGLNNREIAVNLLISEKTVENQLTKALKVIRKGLGKYQAD